MPVHNDYEHLNSLLEDLREYPQLEIFAVDFGASDASQSNGEEFHVIVSDRLGRGEQIALGALQSNRYWIWILHADSRVSSVNIEEFAKAITKCRWGRFDVRLAGKRTIYRVIERLMNARSALTSICTGDQGIFVQRSLLEEIGGIPRQSLMEDIELSKRLRKVEKPYRIRSQMLASVRKWEREGVLATIVRMWTVRMRYFLGAHPDVLYQDYYGRGRAE
ncbi:MAG: TIGR04283 family arsenosugar biosynthesis glycosyltransferase [Gammaproteobacteria bacterium]|nr:TIGR04283 family arsenosugar biosynthesis glycosyltransferase [Gammaproteobacteria bacterium]